MLTFDSPPLHTFCLPVLGALRSASWLLKRPAISIRIPPDAGMLAHYLKQYSAASSSWAKLVSKSLFSMVNSKIPLTTPYSMSCTIAFTFPRITDSSVSSSGIGKSPDSICDRSLFSNFSVESNPTQTPMRRAPDTCVSFLARATSASTTTTCCCWGCSSPSSPPSPGSSAAGDAAAVRTPSAVKPYRPVASTFRNSSRNSSRSKVAPSATLSIIIGSTNRPPPSATSFFTRLVLPVPAGPQTNSTGFRFSSKSPPEAPSSPPSLASCAILSATPALPGSISPRLSPTTGDSCDAKSVTRYVRNPSMAHANCSAVTVENMLPGPSGPRGPLAPSATLRTATVTRTIAGRPKRRLDTFFPSLAPALPNVSVLTERKKTYPTPAMAPARYVMASSKPRRSSTRTVPKSPARAASLRSLIFNAAYRSASLWTTSSFTGTAAGPSYPTSLY
mmetsp:Transcript_53447/g.159948  ORF Transcript_53447/g.159948 Transcript_53447/m.159948 type:complete len:447 (-) Transcript_53447:622-1962(-)